MHYTSLAYQGKNPLFFLQTLSNSFYIDILEIEYCCTQWSLYEFLLQKIKTYYEVYATLVSFI